jgi:hypothetical protein
MAGSVQEICLRRYPTAESSVPPRLVVGGDHACDYRPQVHHGSGRYLLDLVEGIPGGPHIFIVLIIERA